MVGARRRVQHDFDLLKSMRERIVKLTQAKCDLPTPPSDLQLLQQQSFENGGKMFSLKARLYHV